MDGRKFRNKEDLIKLLEVNDEDNFQGLIDAISNGNEELIEDEVFALDFKFIKGHQCSDEWVNALIILIKHCIDNQYTGSYQIINIFPPNWERFSNTGQQLILNLCKSYKNNKFNELTQLVMLQILGESW